MSLLLLQWLVGTQAQNPIGMSLLLVGKRAKGVFKFNKGQQKAETSVLQSQGGLRGLINAGQCLKGG